MPPARRFARAVHDLLIGKASGKVWGMKIGQNFVTADLLNGREASLFPALSWAEICSGET